LSDTLAAVLTHDPDLSALPSTTPPAVRTLLARCLQRDVKLRLRDIGEARIALSRLPETAADAASSPAPRESPRARPFVLLIAAIAAIAIVSAALFLWSTSPSRSSDREAPLLTLGIDAGGDTAIAGVGWIGLNWVGPVAVLSPDGRTLVFIARGPSGGRWQLYARRLDELKASPVPGTEGAYAPFFSPDGNSVGFFAGGRLMKVALNGGKATPICQVEEARGGAWSDDGTIIFAPRPEGPLYRVSSAGGTPSPATTLDSAAGETTHRWPQFLPGGKAFIFTAHGNDGAARGGDVIAQTAETRRMIHRGALFARYAASGHLLYVNDGKLFAAPFHPDRLELAGRAVPVADDVANALINGTAQFSVSNTGLLAYRRARSPNRLLQWMAPSGQVQQLRSVPAEYQEVRFSPTGDRLLLVIGERRETGADDPPRQLRADALDQRAARAELRPHIRPGVGVHVAAVPGDEPHLIAVGGQQTRVGGDGDLDAADRGRAGVVQDCNSSLHGISSVCVVPPHPLPPLPRRERGFQAAGAVPSFATHRTSKR
jgi:serine/threonine-protein kinase